MKRRDLKNSAVTIVQILAAFAIGLGARAGRHADWNRAALSGS
jgi:hypothetical protein